MARRLILFLVLVGPLAALGCVDLSTPKAAPSCDGGDCGAPPDGAAPTAGLANGRPCQSGAECASSFCVDGVCCQHACAGVCRSCNVAGSVGACVLLAPGVLAPSECSAEAASSCGRDGTCDGNGGCRLHALGTRCAEPSCTAGRETSARTCDGLGSCRAATTKSCEPYSCGGTECRSSCSAPDHCLGSSSCEGSKMTCSGLLPIGAACNASSACLSGACVDGVCCNSACNDSCSACNVSGAIGVCSRDPAAAIAPAGGLSATGGPGRIGLSWAVSSGATSYAVKRRTTSASAYTTISSGLSATTFVDTNVTSGTQYHYVVIAAGACGESAPSADVVAETNGKVLLVVGTTPLTPGDLAVKQRLEAKGFEVAAINDGDASDSSTEGKALVVIAESTSVGSLMGKFRDVPVPLLVMEANALGELRMTGSSSSTDHGVSSGQSSVVVSAGHPLAAGQSGTVTVVTADGNFGWGRPAPGAQNIATLASDNNRVALFGYEAGAAMVGMSAPRRRVFAFPTDGSATKLNAQGLSLLDAAISWAAGL